MAVKTSEIPKRSARAQLTEYQRKRDFSRTGEPSGDAPPVPSRTGRLRNTLPVISTSIFASSSMA